MTRKTMRRVRPGEVPPDGGTAVQEDPDRPVFNGNGGYDYVCVECGNVLAASMPPEWMNRKLRVKCGRCRTVNAAVEEDGVDYTIAFGRGPFAGVRPTAPPRTFVTGLVLAAGRSTRLGHPKQLLPYGEGTLLGHVLGVARECPFDQRLCVIGGAGDEVRASVGFDGFTVVENATPAEGCSSSIAAALSAVDARAEVLVLMLGDQPGVTPGTVRALLEGRGIARLAACRYEDGRGHPLAFARSMFAELASMHGDKAVWKLLDRHADAVVDVPIEGPVPPDIDTWEDHAALTGESTPRGQV